MYHRKNGSIDYFMDTSYYKCLLQKVSLFQLKNKLGRASGVGSGRRKGESDGGRRESAKEEGSMKPKNASLRKQKSPKQEGTRQRWSVKKQRNTGRAAIFPF